MRRTELKRGANGITRDASISAELCGVFAGLPGEARNPRALA
jgi:hypothetical protein